MHVYIPVWVFVLFAILFFKPQSAALGGFLVWLLVRAIFIPIAIVCTILTPMGLARGEVTTNDLKKVWLFALGRYSNL